METTPARYYRAHFVLLALLVLCLPVSKVAGQVSSFDSLAYRLEQTIDPAEKIVLLIQIIEEYKDIDTKTAMAYANSAIRQSENAGYEIGKAEVLAKLGEIYENDNLFELAIQNYNSSLGIFKNLKDEKGMARLYTSLGQIYMKKAAYRLSLQNTNESLRLYEKLKDNVGISKAYNCLGSFYKYQLNYNKALEFYDMGLELSLVENDVGGLAQTYKNIGAIHHIEGNYDLALDNYDRSLQLNKEIRVSKNVAVLLGNIGQVLLELGKFEEAYAHFSESQTINSAIGFSKGVASQYVNISSYFELKGQFDLAIDNLSKAYYLLNEIGRVKDIIDISRKLGELNYKIGQYKKAYNYQQEYQSISDSISNVKMTENIYPQENAYKGERRLDNFTNAKQKNLIRNYAIFGVIGLLLVIIYFLYNKQRSKMRQHLLESKNMELEKNQIESDLAMKNKELATFALYIAKKNQLLKVVIGKLERAKPDLNVINIPKIESVISSLRETADSDAWDEFEIRFTNVFDSFYENLQNSYPDITMNEKRLAAFLRLDMTSKEISSITNQSLHSINVARTRFRKKLNLSNKDIKLATFLSKF